MATHSSPQIIVGRKREQQQLRALLDQALAGSGGLVLVSGEAGIGKTSLVSWLADEASELNVAVLRGNCYDLTTTPPYGPWIEMTRRYPASTALPALPHSLNPDHWMEDVASQAELFELALAFFADVARQRSLLLILEDLHWGDNATLELRATLGECSLTSRYS